MRLAVRRGRFAASIHNVLTVRSHEDNTMIRIISALILAIAANLVNAADQPLKLADAAPDQHIVVRGDTLWDISAKFLKDLVKALENFSLLLMQ